MTRFVIGPDVALQLAEADAAIPAKHKLLSPTLLRSQFLARLYESVRRGDIDRKSANGKLDYLRSLKIRLLGDRVLQRVAWEIADQLDWPDTYQAEYLALTRLQADAFITLDRDLAQTAKAIVPVASIEDLTKSHNS